MILTPTPESEGQLIASGLVLASEIRGEDAEDTRLLQAMSSEAHRYISSFPWCTAIRNSYFGGGVGGIFAVFFFQIESGRVDVPSWIWAMVGDIPPAYLPVTDCKSPAEAYHLYLAGMSRWCELARLGKKGTAEEGIPPVEVPATPEWAENLSKRLQTFEFLVKPFFEPESNTLN